MGSYLSGGLDSSLVAALGTAEDDPAVRALVLSGEAVLPDDLSRWSTLHAAGGPRLVNTYAITETGGNVMFREYAAWVAAQKAIEQYEGTPFHGFTTSGLAAAGPATVFATAAGGFTRVATVRFDLTK